METKVRNRKVRGFAGKSLLRFKRYILITLNQDISEILDFWVEMWEHNVNNHGMLFASKRSKELYNLGLRYAIRQPISPIPFVSSYKDGFPKCLKAFKKLLLSDDIQKKRAALAVLSLWRMVRVKGPWNIKTITDPGLLTPLHSSERSYLGKYFNRLIEATPKDSDKALIRQIRNCWVEEIQLAFPRDSQGTRVQKLAELSGLHISSKNGPNGPSMACSIVDFSALNRAENLGLLEAIKELSKITQNSPLTDLLGNIGSASVEGKFSGSILSKISLKVEPGGKMRPFAICDWFSQSSLLPIHRYLYSWLREQDNDGTFSHNRVAQLAKDWTTLAPTLDKVCISSDLTAATDRLPRDLQREILEEIFGPEIGTLWLKIVGEREFTSPDGDIISYTVGQPMGILSSWAMLAVWHHLFIRTLIRFLGLKDPKDRYLVIGDDVLTRGVLLGHTYQYVSTNIIGLTISTEKSIDPLKGERVSDQLLHVCEIAKRVFINGEEVTTVPPDQVDIGLSYAYAFPNLVDSMVDRGYLNGSFEGPVPLLARLHDKCNQAILQSSFPFNPSAPYRGLSEIYKKSYPLGDRSLGASYEVAWWKYPPDEVEYIYSNLLHIRMIEAFRNSYEEGEKYKSLAQSQDTIKVSKWSVDISLLSPIILAICKECEEQSSKKSFGGLMMTTLPPDSVKDLIAKNHVFMDLRLALQGRTDFRDEKVKTSTFLSRIYKEILESLNK